MALVFARPGVVFQTLVISGGLVAWNVNAGDGANLTLDQNVTLSNPTNLKTNEFYTMQITQNATGNYAITAVGSTYERIPMIYRAPNAVTNVVFRYDGTKLRVVSEAPGVRDIFLFARPGGSAIGTSPVQWATQPSARTEWASGNLRQKIDLSQVNEAKLVIGITSAAAVAGAKAAVMFSLDDWVTPVYLDGNPASTPIGSEQPQVGLSTASSVQESNWIAIASSAKVASCGISIFASGGNGVTSPSFNYANLRLR